MGSLRFAPLKRAGVAATVMCTVLFASQAFGEVTTPALGENTALKQALDTVSLSSSAVADCLPSEPGYEDCLTLALLIEYAVIYDIGLIAGFLPPPPGYIGEGTAYASNIALKFFPAWLQAPANREVDPNAGDGVNHQNVDGCGITFDLLSPQAEYTNVFGTLNLRESYSQLNPKRVFPWRNLADPDNTRWGFLRAPRVYHANSDVTVSIRTPYTVRPYDPATGDFGPPKMPIITGAESPQQVYLPIGAHPIEWIAATELNYVSDIVLDPVMLLAGILAEKAVSKAGKHAYSYLKNVKSDGIADDIAEEALDAKLAERVSEGIKKSNIVLTEAFDSRQAKKVVLKAAKERRQKIARRIAEQYAKAVTLKYYQISKKGFQSFDDTTKEQIRELFGSTVANTVEIVQCELQERFPLQYGVQPVPGERPIGCSGPIDAGFVDHNISSVAVSIIRKVLSNYGPEAIIDFIEIDTAFVGKVQAVTVYDSVPPTISFSSPNYPVRATDFGGTRLYRIRQELLDLATASSSDNCGRTPEILIDAPEFLPLGDHEITITARDWGPNPPDDGQDYAPTAVLNIRVRDTEPPLMLAPPSKVILSSVDVSRDAAEIGDAVAVDLVDVQPDVSNDAIDVFPVDSRTPILWTAVDDSDNVAQASQLVTVKASNTPPTANGRSASAVTAEPVRIKLTANDIDFLDNQFDPLAFRIESYPEHGEFIAPLYPFFIEDYRTRPNDGLPGFDPVTDDVHAFVESNYCDRGDPDFVFPDGEPPINFVHKPLYVHVTDDNIRYVLDEYFFCLDESGKADTETRVSKWNSSNDFLGHIEIDRETFRLINDTFRVDRDGLLYYNTMVNGGTNSAVLGLHQCPTEAWTEDPLAISCTEIQSWSNFGRLDSDSSYARIDSTRDVAYVVANKRLYANDLRPNSGLLVELGPKDANGDVLDDWFGKIPTLEVGSDGALYANDVERHRIHKLAPATVDENGELVTGDYIGWAGKCTTSGYGDCEIDVNNPAEGRSFGYSCTWDDGVPTCETSELSTCRIDPNDPDAPLRQNFEPESGCRQGQFDTPSYISIDPNDVLYVADFENWRIQRLSPDGSFAGEAVSTGTGVNKGSRPSFILGNMGRPESVSVNSSHFYVVDWRERFVYVFGTLPFEDISESNEPGASMEATVTYVSDQRFPNPNTSGDDRFSFSATDGLDSSAPAEVIVTVNRAFRPPQAASVTVSTTEDTPVNFELPAGDPDGVLGEEPDGLDTLTYSVIRRPENGTLSGYADSYTYTPFPDFYGTDTLVFIVNDGVDDSNEGTIVLDVTPINDPPVVEINPPSRVARGFPILLESTFVDDRFNGDSGGYESTIDWGDGSSDTNGEFVNDGENASMSGVIVIAPFSDDPDAKGRAVADHTYDQTGEKLIEVCVADSASLTGCDQANINVESLVVFDVSGIFYDGPLEDGDITLAEMPDGSSFTYEVTITNAEPVSGAGLAADDVLLDLFLPDGVTVGNVVIGHGSCVRAGTEISCDIGSLDPGEQAILTMSVIGPGDLIYDEIYDFEGSLETSTDSSNEAFDLFSTIELVADLTDSDGDGMSDVFETTYGLNPGFDDSADDADGDGLSNIDEFTEGTSPLVADTDGDGMSDGDEVLAGLDPLADDIAPDVTVPPDIMVNATGVLTAVNLGVASAADFKDGAVEIVADNAGPFRPGNHVVTWSAVDEAGNRGDGYQFVKVVPIVSFQVDQAVSEGTVAVARVELNGPPVQYPVTVLYQISGTATNPEDHNAVSGVAVIEAGLSTEIAIAIVADLVDEPDETIQLTMGIPINAVVGAIATHTITVTEQNRAPAVDIIVEQHGRASTTIASEAGLIGIIADIRDDPAQDHTFDWSASDSALVDPIAANDPAYLLDPSGLGEGLYLTRVDVVDNGVPQLAGQASSLLKVVGDQVVLRSVDDTDGDGENDAAEGPDDSDGDRIPNYLDDVPNANVLKLSVDGRMLETIPGLRLRLGAVAFEQDSVYPAVVEEIVGTDVDFAYPGDVLDFEITNLDQGGSAQIVIPLASLIARDSRYRINVNGQWQDIIEDANNIVASAAGEQGACPPPTSGAYGAGLQESDGCVRLTLNDGGWNDSDGVTDGVVRILGGLAVPVSARSEPMAQSHTTLTGDGEAIMVRMRLHSDSGGAVMNSITLQATGEDDDVAIDHVVLIHDTNRDGEWDDDDILLATNQYAVDDGELTFVLDEPLKLVFGDTDLLVVYVLGDLE